MDARQIGILEQKRLLPIFPSLCVQTKYGEITRAFSALNEERWAGTFHKTNLIDELTAKIAEFVILVREDLNIPEEDLDGGYLSIDGMEDLIKVREDISEDYKVEFQVVFNIWKENLDERVWNETLRKLLKGFECPSVEN